MTLWKALIDRQAARELRSFFTMSEWMIVPA